MLTKFHRTDDIEPALAYLDQLRQTAVAVSEEAYLGIYLGPPRRH